MAIEAFDMHFEPKTFRDIVDCRMVICDTKVYIRWMVVWMVSLAIRFHELIRHEVSVEALASVKVDGNGRGFLCIVSCQPGFV